MSVKFKYMNIKIKDRINIIKNQNKIEINFDEEKMERFLLFKRKISPQFPKRNSQQNRNNEDLKRD
ncbi:hypothetical protein PT136_04585 (plasmid) [Borreliella garinii]|uniref:hypothetical protein n=1 Tax=Borreliella garinii TaxID=29519 RepID=UPI00292CF391|nr:hypothetical protein [Borreliella garinii]WNZ72120.1 hypothetical protein PT136_04585 [Borreliella garinii]